MKPNSMAMSPNHSHTPRPNAGASLIICTKNRIGFLSNTLKSLLPQLHNFSRLLEVIIIDNGSTDGTDDMLAELAAKWSKVRYEYFPEPGLSRARNKAISIARGEILIWTDDDLIVCNDWIQQMLAPIDRGEADCVVGRIEIAPHLQRNWMTPLHRGMLAENIDPTELKLIGANMSLRRDCFEGGILFDTETGPGVLGYMDDTLLGIRLQRSGKRIVYNDAARVVHHFGAERLNRAFWIKTAHASGRSTAYVSYHWDHVTVDRLEMRILHQQSKLLFLLLRRFLNLRREHEGMLSVEFGIRKTLSYYQSMRLLQRIPFKY